MASIAVPSRRYQTCERMSTPTPRPATPERQDIRIPGLGELIGRIVIRPWVVESWAWDADGNPIWLRTTTGTDSDARLTAVCKVWDYYDRTLIKAPHHLRYKRRAA